MTATTYPETYVVGIMNDAWTYGETDAREAIAWIVHNLTPSDAWEMLRAWDHGEFPADDSPLSGEWADGRDYRDWLHGSIVDADWATDAEAFAIVEESIMRYEEAYFGTFENVLRPALNAMIRD